MRTPPALGGGACSGRIYKARLGGGVSRFGSGFLGGGVKPNKPKIGIRRAGYKGQACNADMHFWVAKKKPPRSGLARWGGTPSSK